MSLSGATYNKILIIASFLFLLIAKSLAGSIYSTLLSVLLIIVLVLSLIGSPKIIFPSSLRNYVFWLYILLFLLSLVRQFFFTELSFTGLVNVLLFFTVIILVQFVALFRIKPNMEELVRLLYNMLNVYISLNVFLFLLGFEKARYAGINSTLGQIGIDIDRVFFIFSPSMAYFAMLCGISCLVSLLLYIKTKYVRYLGSLIISISALILTDSRGPIFGLIIIFLLVFAIRRFWIKFQFAFFLFYIFSVNLFLSIMAFINKYLFDIEQLSRGGNTTLLSWRDVIWGIFFDHYDPSIFNFLFGYGNVGQMISGISSEYKYLFANWPNPDHISLHNNTLQLLVDIGIVGAISLLIVMYSVVKYCIKQYSISNNILVLAIPAIINYMLLLGFSDIITNISNVGVYFILILITVSIIGENRENPTLSNYP